MSTVNNLIDALGNNKTSAANTTFAAVMSSKINAALNTRKIGMADAVYNGVINRQELENADIQNVETEA